MKKIVIVDYDCGNLLSLKRGIEKIGLTSEISRDQNKILNSTHLILPGVGAFGNAMDLLKKFDLENIIKKYALEMKKPLLGICLGMQLMLSKSFEFGEHEGLGIINGKVIKINHSTNSKIKVPNIGWSEIIIEKEKSFETFNNKSFYFVHSFISVTENKNETIAHCNYYDLKIPSIIKKNNVIGCQFHPEKSSKNGLRFLEYFCNSN